jgi:DNA-binding transcriptional LysR family regulator
MQGHIGLEDLRLLHAIGMAATLTGAARALGVNLSTAFRRLAALERRLGVRLFDRSRAGYTPTPAGEIALAAAESLLNGLGELERRLAGVDLRTEGAIRVTTTDTLLDFLAPAFAAFRAAYPRVTLDVVATNAFFTLTRRDADVAIRPSLTAPDYLVGRRVAGIAVAPYATPEYLARRSDRSDLREHDWIAPDETLRHLGSASWIAKNIPPGRVILKGNSLLVLLAAARAGIGIAPSPCYLGDADPALIRAGPVIPEMASALWLLTHPDLRRVARIRAFLDFMASWLADRHSVLEGLTPSGKLRKRHLARNADPSRNRTGRPVA